MRLTASRRRAADHWRPWRRRETCRRHQGSPL